MTLILHLEKAFSDLYLNTEFSDVTLVSQDGNYVHAHKIIISAGSLELRKQILSLKQQHVLNIKTNFDDLKLIVQFIYTGFCELEPAYLVKFMETAKQMQIKGLSTIDANYIGRTPTKYNIITEVQNYKEYVQDQQELKADKLYETIAKNSSDQIQQIFKSEEEEYIPAIGDMGKNKEENNTHKDHEVKLNKFEDFNDQGYLVEKEQEHAPTLNQSYNMTENNSPSKCKKRVKEESKKLEIGKDYIVKAIEGYSDMTDLDRKVRCMMVKGQFGERVTNSISRKAYNYNCSSCNKDGHFGEIRNHIEVYHLKNICIPCKFCGKVFRSRKNLESHKRKDKTCYNDTNQEFTHGLPDINQAKEHKARFNTERKVYCNICDVYFLKKCQDSHVLLHKTSTLSCNECKIDSFTFRGFIKHNIKVHKRTDNIFECEHCGVKATFKAAVNNHKLKIHSEMLYGCEECDFKSVDNEKVNHHMRLSHPKFTCQICKLNLPIQKQEEHMETHKVNGQLSCDLCEYRATVKTRIPAYMIKLHKMWNHSDVSFQCDEKGCDYKTTRKDSIKRHKENIHLQIKYTCDECGHQASTNSNLHQHKASKHLLTSSDITCDICGNTSAVFDPLGRIYPGMICMVTLFWC